MADAVETILKRDLNEVRKKCAARAADFSWLIAGESMIDLFNSLTQKQALWAA